VCVDRAHPHQSLPRHVDVDFDYCTFTFCFTITFDDSINNSHVPTFVPADRKSTSNMHGRVAEVDVLKYYSFAPSRPSLALKATDASRDVIY
jgi:hypothetical protein